VSKSARVVLGVAIAIVVPSVLIWATCRDRITFFIDRRTVENALRVQGFSIDEQGFETNSVDSGKSLPPESIPKPDMEINIEGRTIHFFGAGVARQTSHWLFKSSDLSIFVYDTWANDLGGPGPGYSGAGADCLRSFIQSTDRFEVMKQVRCARLSDIDATSDLCSKYRALYLYSMRRVSQWKDVEEMREYLYPRHKILLQKSQGGRRWLAMAYFPDQRSFVDITISPQKEVPFSVVESILASLSMEGPTR
jgi:hypothetical protein